MGKDIAQTGLDQVVFPGRFDHAVQAVHFLQIDFPRAAAFVKRRADGVGEMCIAGVVSG